MNTMHDPRSVDTSGHVALPAMSVRRLLHAYGAEIGSECRRYLRSTAFMLPALLFPCAFYVMFAIVLNRASGPDVGRYLLVAYVIFGAMGPGLFGFGVALANERENGLLTLKRALPMPPLAHLLGKLVLAMCMAAVIAILLLAMGQLLAGLALISAQMMRLIGLAVLTAIPFCALGLLIGSRVSGNAAAGVDNLVYLPMAFLSGLWVPLTMLPKVGSVIAPWLPSWHLHQLGLQVVSAPAWGDCNPLAGGAGVLGIGAGAGGTWSGSAWMTGLGCLHVCPA